MKKWLISPTAKQLTLHWILVILWDLVINFFATPWNAFTCDREEDCFIRNLGKERFKDAPGFEKDDRPNFMSPNIAASID